MLSRIASSLYWMGRHLERAENTARLLQVNSLAMTESPVNAGTAELVAGSWEQLLAMTDDREQFDVWYTGAGREEVVEWLTAHPGNPSSVRASLANARDNARTVRFHINLEMWEALNRCYNDLRGLEADLPSYAGLNAYCAAVRETTNLFFGIAEATLPRNEGWYFLSLGRYLERMDNVLRLLFSEYGEAPHPAYSDSVVRDFRSRAFLRSVGAYEAFRKRENLALDPAAIADFLLLDSTFPRSVRWSAERANEASHAIEGLTGGSPQPARLAGWLAAQLEYLPGGTQVIQQQRPSLSELIDAVAEIAEKTDLAYFQVQAPDLLLSIPQQQQQQQQQCSPH